jgi:signal transduction histidine kinase
MTTVGRRKIDFVCSAGDLAVCRVGDLQPRISAARQMKNPPIVTTLVSVTRLRRGEILDRWVAAGLAVAAQVMLWTGDVTPGLPKGLGAPLALVMASTVAFRRRWPLAAGALVVACTNLIFLVGAHNYSVPLSIAWMCGLYAIAVWTDTTRFLIGFGVLAGSTFLAAAGPVVKLTDAVFFTVVPGIAVVIARRAVRERQLLAEALAARAELLERDNEMRTSEAVAEERARIARELHDLVAHNVSVMVVQAGVERHALPESQASTRETLTSIEQAGRQALVEARRLLGVLRRNGEREGLEPQPSIDQVHFLVEQVERAGLPVDFAVEGDRSPLPAGLDLCAYRIVQEALTNALKHAGPARAQVVLRYEDSGLDIQVSDDGRGPAAANGDGVGHGLIGMGERVALYGGRLRTGGRDGGGFEVHAHLPLA